MPSSRPPVALAASSLLPLRVAVVGAGPAGLYAADRLLHRLGEGVRVDVLERLPAPLGLVRYGVAPDHGATSQPVAQRFGRLLADARVRLLCNVSVGEPGATAAARGALRLQLPLLQQRYHAVVLATGAQRERRLGVPGEGLMGVFSATSFVAWYTGHPGHALDAPPPPPPLLTGARHAVVVGLGNVALDCARLLLRPPGDLHTASSAPSHVLRALTDSTVDHVTLVARRSAAQAAATPKELRELFGLPGVRVLCDTLGLAAEDEQELQGDAGPVRSHRRAVEEMRKAAARGEGAAGPRTLRLLFLRSPAAFLPRPDAPDRVGAVQLQPEYLRGPPGKRRTGGPAPADAVPSPSSLLLPADLVVCSTGNWGEPVEGAPFDEASGTVPHARGQVLTAAAGGEPVPGLFVTGWLKRGAKGIIGTNLECAEETAGAVEAAARGGGLAPPTLPALSEDPRLRAGGGGVRLLSASGWAAMEEAERRAGEAGGRGGQPEKLTCLPEMLAFSDRGWTEDGSSTSR